MKRESKGKRTVDVKYVRKKSSRVKSIYYSRKLSNCWKKYDIILVENYQGIVNMEQFYLKHNFQNLKSHLFRASFRIFESLMYEKVRNKNKARIINFKRERKLLIALSVSATKFVPQVVDGSNFQNSLELHSHFQLYMPREPIRDTLFNHDRNAIYFYFVVLDKELLSLNRYFAKSSGWLN